VDPLFHEVFHQVMSFRGVLSEYIQNIKWRQNHEWLDWFCAKIPGFGFTAEQLELLENLQERSQRTATILSASAFIVEYLEIATDLPPESRKRLQDSLHHLAEAQSHMRRYHSPLTSRKATKDGGIDSGLSVPDVIEHLIEHYHHLEGTQHHPDHPEHHPHQGQREHPHNPIQEAAKTT